MENTNVTIKKSQWKKSFYIKHEILLFFLISITYSWVIYFFIFLSNIQDQTLLSRLLLIAAFGPSIAALVITHLTNIDTNGDFPVRRQIFLFAVMFSIVFGIELLDHFWWKHEISSSLIFADFILVSLASIIISNIFSNKESVRDLVKSIIKWRISFLIIILSIVLWPSLIFLSGKFALILGMDVSKEPSWPNIPFIFIVTESFIWYLFFGGPLNEELGWRGFALNKLQIRYSPLISSIIIGAIWALWHLPLHLMGVYPFGVQGFLIRIFDIPSAVLFTWLYNRSKNSLLPVLLLHSARNTTSLFMSRSYVISSLLLLVLSIVLVFIDKMWEKVNFKRYQS